MRREASRTATAATAATTRSEATARDVEAKEGQPGRGEGMVAETAALESAVAMLCSSMKTRLFVS